MSVISRHFFHGVVVGSNILKCQLIEGDISILIVYCISDFLSGLVLQNEVELAVLQRASGQCLLHLDLSGDRGILRSSAVRIIECEQRCRIRIGFCRDVTLSVILYGDLYGLGFGVIAYTRLVSGFLHLIGKGLLRRITQVILAIGNGSEVHRAIRLVLHFRLLRHRCIRFIGCNLEAELICLQLTSFQHLLSFEVYCCLFRLVQILKRNLLSGYGLHRQLTGSVVRCHYTECLNLGILLQRTVARCIFDYRIVNAVLCSVLQRLFVCITLCHQLLQARNGVGQLAELNGCILTAGRSSGDYRFSIFMTGIVYAELELVVLYRQLVSGLIQQSLRTRRCIFAGGLVNVLERRLALLNRAHNTVLLENLNLEGLRLGVVSHSGFSAVLLRYGKSIFSFLREFRSAKGKGSLLAVLHAAQACIRIGQHDIFLFDGLLSDLITGLQCEIELLTIQHAASHQFLRTGNGRIAFHGRRCILIGKYHCICTLAAGSDTLFCFQLTAHIRYLVGQGVFGRIVVVACLIAQIFGDLVGIGSGPGKGNLSEVRLSFPCNRYRLLAIHAALRHRCIVGTGEGKAEGAVLRRISSGNLLLYARSRIRRIYAVGVLEQNRAGSAGPCYLQGSVQIIRYNCTDFVRSRIVSDVAVVSGHFLYGVVIGSHVLEGQCREGDVSILIVGCIANGLSIFILQYKVEFAIFHGTSGKSLLNRNLSGNRGFLGRGAVRIVKRKQWCRLWIQLCRDVALSIIFYRYLYGFGLGVVGNARAISGFGDFIGKGLRRRIPQIILAVGNGSEVHAAVGSILCLPRFRHRCIGIIGSDLEGELIRLQTAAFQHLQSFEVYRCLLRFVFVLEIQFLPGCGLYRQFSGSVVRHHCPEGLSLRVLLQRTVSRILFGYRIVNAVFGAVLQHLLVRVTLCCQLFQVGDRVGQGTEVNRCILAVSGGSGGHRFPIFMTGIVYVKLKLAVFHGQLISVLVQQGLGSCRCVFSGSFVDVLAAWRIHLNRLQHTVFLGNLHLQNLSFGVVFHSRLSTVLLRYDKGVFAFFGEFRSAEHEGGGGSVCQGAYSRIGVSQHDVLLVDGLLCGLIAGFQREVEFFVLQHVPANQRLESGDGGIPVHHCRGKGIRYGCGQLTVCVHHFQMALIICHLYGKGALPVVVIPAARCRRCGFLNFELIGSGLGDLHRLEGFRFRTVRRNAVGSLHFGIRRHLHRISVVLRCGQLEGERFCGFLPDYNLCNLQCGIAFQLQFLRLVCIGDYRISIRVCTLCGCVERYRIFFYRVFIFVIVCIELIQIVERPFPVVRFGDRLALNFLAVSEKVNRNGFRTHLAAVVGILPNLLSLYAGRRFVVFVIKFRRAAAFAVVQIRRFDGQFSGASVVRNGHVHRMRRRIVGHVGHASALGNRVSKSF